MNGLLVENIHKAFTDNSLVLTGISFTQPRSEVLALLGPSGCGKSTLLSIIAGLLAPDQGVVKWNGNDLAGIPPHKRGFGLMFQDYALFPHMRVRDNVAFGLRMQGLSRPMIDKKVSEILAIVGLPGFEGRDVHTLSGGEQQRIALARALAPQPGLLMLDEPLGSLDRALRAQLLEDLRGIVRQTQQTTIYVTHDQEEAYALADKVVVMQAGKVAQIGRPEEIYKSPASAYVARFVGLTNLIPAEVDGQIAHSPLGDFTLAAPADGQRLVLLRPDAANLKSKGHPFTGRITDVAFMGESIRAEIKIKEQKLSFEFPASANLPATGEEFTFHIDLGQEFQSFPTEN